MSVAHRFGIPNRIYDWLAVSDPPQQADIIFVLAGREYRKSFGLRLLEEGWATTLLLSVARFEIRRFSRLKVPVSLDLVAIASMTGPRRRHYFIKIEGAKAECRKIPVGLFGTWSEILEFSHWLKANGPIGSALVVSSGFHLRRTRMCCRRLVHDCTKLTFVAVPDENRYFRNHWWRNSKARKLVLSELLKIALYGMLGQRLLKQASSASAFTEG